MSCLVCVMHEEGGACREEQAATYTIAHLGALYLVMSRPVSIEEHFKRFLRSLCPEHRGFAHGYMKSLIEDEDEPKVKRRLVGLLGATPS